MPFNANNEWIPESDSVADRVSALTSKDSSIMRNATAMGMRMANRRGLANSSISAGAARSATLSAAVPIASQEAQMIGAKNLQRIQGDQAITDRRMQLEFAEREGAANRIAGAFEGYNNQIASINQNNKMKANTRAAMQGSARDVLMAQLTSFQKLYPGVKLNWG